METAVVRKTVTVLYYHCIIVIFRFLLEASQFTDMFILIYQIFSGGRENGEQRSQT